MYNKEDISSKNKLRASWANKVESNLHRLGSYQGEVADFAALPDPSTKSLNDWYLCLDDNQIYINIDSEWVESNPSSMSQTIYSICDTDLSEYGSSTLSAKLYGATFVNALGYNGLNVANAAAKSFTSINGHVYFNSTGDTIKTRITGDGGSKSVTNSTGDTADIIVLDLTDMGDLDNARKEYYSYKYGIVVDTWSELEDEDIYSEVSGKYFVVKSVGFDEVGSKSTFINGDIFDIELHSLNGYSDYIDTYTGKKIIYNKRELVDISSNAAQLSYSGSGIAVVFDSSNVYRGSVSGTDLSVTAVDGEYTVIYTLDTAQEEEANVRGINSDDNYGTLWDYTSSESALERTSMIMFSMKNGVEFYAQGMELDREIRAVYKCEIFNGSSVIDALDNIEINTNGFTISTANDGDTITYECEIIDSFVSPSFELYVPTTIKKEAENSITKTNELKETIRQNRIFLEVLKRSIQKIGIENESNLIVMHGSDTFESNNYKQIPEITIYGQTLLNEIGRPENINKDTNEDGVADYYLLSDELDAEFNNKEQRIYADEVTESQEFIFTPDTEEATDSVVSIDKVEVNRLADGIGSTLGLYAWEAGIANWTLTGKTLVNLIYSGKDVPDGEGRYFKACLGNTYIDILNETKIEGDNTYYLVENSSGDAADLAVYDLTSMGKLTQAEADKANALSGGSYDTDTLWEDLTAETLVGMLYFVDNYTKEYTSSITNTRNSAVLSHVNINTPALSLKDYRNIINSNGTATKYVWLSDYSDGSYTYLGELDNDDYIQVEIDSIFEEEIEDFEIGVVWDYSSDASALSRDIKDITVETFWDYSSDVSTLRRTLA